MGSRVELRAGRKRTARSQDVVPEPAADHHPARRQGVDAYNDLTPRVGVAYDVFGNGKTALKFNWGKYLAYAANDSPYTSTNPGATIVRSVANRGWNAAVAAGGNGDLVVDCNLLNPDANGECAAVTGNAPQLRHARAPRRRSIPAC